MVIRIPTGVGLQTRELGDKAARPLLMVGPTAAPWVIWETLAQSFSTQFRVVNFDYRGTGGSERGEGSMSVGSLAEDAIAVLDALGIDRACILGWSLGSAVTQEMAIRYPNRIAGLVLWGTWARTDPHQRALFTALRHPWATGDLIDALTSLSLIFSPEYVNSPGMTEAMASLLPAFPNSPTGMRSVVEQWNANLQHDAQARLSQITAPALVVAGEQDLVTPVRLGREVAEMIPGAELQVLSGPGSSHALGLERPSEFVPMVMGFLGRCPL